MRTLTNWSLIAILLLSASISIPLTLNNHTGQAALAGDLNRVDANDKDGDEREANDNGLNEDDKDEPDRGGDNSDSNGNGTSPVVAAIEDYTVETECKFDDDDNITKCEFSGVAPDDASDIGRLTVPAHTVCTEVLGGDFVFVDPTSKASITGYASEEDDDKLKLELHGEVTTADTMTYWISIIGNVVPAEGPALRCNQVQDTTLTLGVVATLTPPPQVATGTLVVATYTCDNVPQDTSTFDWFGMCVPGAGPLGFTLTSTDANAAAQHAAGTEASTGEAVFDTIEPGTYQLTSVDASWCHAKSDRVNAQGEVVIQAGEQATVWTCYCSGGKQ